MNGWILILVYSLLQRNGFIRSFLPWKGALGVSGVGAPWGGCDVRGEFHPSHLPPTPNSLFGWHRELLTPRKRPQGVAVTWKSEQWGVTWVGSALCFPGISWGHARSWWELLLEPGDPCWNPLGELQGEAGFFFFKDCKAGRIKVGRCFILNSVAERNLFIFWVSLFPECFVARTCSRAVLSTFLQISFWYPLEKGDAAKIKSNI